MNIRIKGLTVINDDIINKDYPILTLESDLTKITKQTIIIALTKGDEIYNIYKNNRDNLHISNVIQMLNQMEKVYNK